MMLLFGLIFLVSGCASYGELKYLIWGQTTDARVVDVTEMRTRRGRSQLQVEYSFTDNAATRTEFDAVPRSWPGTDGPTVRVQYLPGVPEASRLHGNGGKVWLGAFLACLAIGLFLIFRIWRDARAAVSGAPAVAYDRRYR